MLGRFRMPFAECLKFYKTVMTEVFSTWSTRLKWLRFVLCCLSSKYSVVPLESKIKQLEMQRLKSVDALLFDQHGGSSTCKV
jgi:hypothetical protein